MQKHASSVLDADALKDMSKPEHHDGDDGLSVEIHKLDPQAQRLILMLRHQIELLREKLTKANATDAAAEEYTLEEAKEGLNKCLQRLMEGDETAQQEFDKWDKLISEHPDHLAKLAKERMDWENDQHDINVAACEVVKGFVPDDITKSTVDTLVNRGVLPAVAKRVTKQKSLWLVRDCKDRISKLHIADLRSKFPTQGLDLIELRAVYHSLPWDFRNDSNGEKKEWREQVRRKLVSMVKSESESKLTANQLCHSCYINSESKTFEKMPFVKLEELEQNVLTAFRSLETAAVNSNTTSQMSKTSAKPLPQRNRVQSSKAKASLEALFANKMGKMGGKLPIPKRKPPLSEPVPGKLKPTPQEKGGMTATSKIRQLPSSSSFQEARKALINSMEKKPEKTKTDVPAVKKLNLAPAFLGQLERANSNNRDKLLSECNDKSSRQIELQSITSTADNLPRATRTASLEIAYDSMDQAVDNFNVDTEWHHVEDKPLCEKPLKEQVTVLETCLQVLLSMSMKPTPFSEKKKVETMSRAANMLDSMVMLASPPRRHSSVSEDGFCKVSSSGGNTSCPGDSLQDSLFEEAVNQNNGLSVRESTNETDWLVVQNEIM